MARKVTTMAGPPPLYYLAIDGTEAQDSAVFGALLEGRGWQNLAATFLSPAPDDPTRLVDPAHEFLQIPLVGVRGKQVAVVAPNGRDGKGLEACWKVFKGETRTKRGDTVTGRYSAAEQSAELTQQLMLKPAIHTHELEPDVLKRHFADERLPYGSAHAPAARILYVSSHGFLSGRMQGEPLLKDPTQPEATREEYFPRAWYFLLGAVAAAGAGFHGPEWMILGQCSTVNSTGWPLWARIFARSSPGVRGVLAYEEAAPKPAIAVGISERFFRYLDRGSTFLDAWAEANHGIRWAAIVHKEARGDTLAAFPRFRRLSTVATTKSKASYHGYLSSLSSSGEPIYDKLPPFGFKLEHAVKGGYQEITPANLGEEIAEFAAGDMYRLTMASPDGSNVRKATITAVHIRLSLRDGQIPWSNLFNEFRLESGGALWGFDSTTVTIDRDPDMVGPTLELRVIARHPATTRLQPCHSYVWFRVEIRTDTGAYQYDFKTQGLSH